MDNPVIKALFYLLIFLLIIILGFSIVFIQPVYSKYREAEAVASMKRQEYKALHEETITLATRVHDLEHKKSAAEKVAREKFGLCKEGEEILIYR